MQKSSLRRSVFLGSCSAWRLAMSKLKVGQWLAFNVSDTFITIKSQLSLRKLLMQNYVQKLAHKAYKQKNKQLISIAKLRIEI